MTKSERGFALIDCVGGAAITYAGYLASTGGDLILALVLLTFGTVPTIVHFLTVNLKLGLWKTMLYSIVWTFYVPTAVWIVSLLIGLRWEQDAWFIQPVLHWGATVLTGLMGATYSMIFILLVIQEIMDWTKRNRRTSVI